MTELLKKVFDLASGLPDDEQDALAALILAEIEDDQRWANAFRDSQAALATLASEAVAKQNVEGC